MIEESPSISTNCSPRSLHKIIACKHAMASAAKLEDQQLHRSLFCRSVAPKVSI
ncbi:hypothetical protein V6Z11_A08G145600 [Gossypium hirsutum]|uniref:Uncharacterized protein n=1 Tax=Gossypium tomentosum TaxID=34277 RepID=A0A5D2PEL2_GOSTO|nr:hypothetical protein ES332_A08G147500v1 [Gossypium tomentosum]